MIITKIKNKTKFVFILIAALCLSLISWGVVQLANAEVTVSGTEDIASVYAFGDEFTLPECTFTKNGQSKKGVASLQFPNGALYSDKTVTLNQNGKYLLRYLADIDGKTYTKEYEFSVLGKIASYKSEKTQISYGLCDKYGANSYGLNVRIANGDSLTFEHVFDMTQLTSSTILLEGFVVPDVQGAVDFSKMVFTFTDVEDPSVQLVYNGNFHNDRDAYGLTFFTAAGNGQIQTGLEYVGKLHVGATLGCLVPHSFMSVDTGLYYGAYKYTEEPVRNCPPDTRTFCISYDSKLNQPWASGKIISDLDDTNYYSTLWFGFPSGKAKLTVSALNYTGASANMCIKSVLGVDLSAQNFVDEVAPIISVDTEYTEMPKAIVGKTYPIPTASAIDEVSGKCDVNVSVWYDYATQNQKMVDVVGGKFKADDVGAYAIVYTACDYSGNESKTVLWVRAQLGSYIQKLSATADENYNKNITVGELIDLPEMTVTGGCGNVDSYGITYSITKGSESAQIIGDRFRVEQAGEWNFTCSVKDYIGEVVEVSFTLTATAGNKPIIEEYPQFPKAYVLGSLYTLPIAHAYDYQTGSKVEKLCDVTVLYNGNKQYYKSGDQFKPTVETSGDKIAITYSCDGATLFDTEVPVIDVFRKVRVGESERYRTVIDVEKYFYTEDQISFTNGYEQGGVKGLKATSNQTGSTLSMRFLNPQMANSFSLDMMTVPGESGFSSLNVILTDSENPQISIKATFTKDDGQTVMTVGDTSLIMLLDFESASPSAFSVGFTNGKLSLNSTTLVDVKKMQNGEPFNGFPSGKIYFDVELCDVEEGASIFIDKICSISASNDEDNVGPFISTENAIEINAFKDSVYTMQKILVCDVLSPNSGAYITVTKPDGSVISDENGLPLENVDATKEYKIKLSEYGEYFVSVVAREENWRKSNENYFDYVISVTDGEKPTITFDGEFDDKVKVGGTIVIPKFEVKDNYSNPEDIVVLIIVTNPKGMPVYLYGEENAIRCEYAGVYKINFFVYDQMGNLTTYETQVTVK